MDQTAYYVAVATVIILSSGRLTRLLIVDAFPPVVWLRDKFLDRFEDSPWGLIAQCVYCASFWVTAFVIVLADLSGVFDGEPLAKWMTPAWWLINGAFAAAYLAAILVRVDTTGAE